MQTPKAITSKVIIIKAQVLMKSVQIRARADRKQASEAEENVQLYSAH